MLTGIDQGLVQFAGLWTFYCARVILCLLTTSRRPFCQEICGSCLSLLNWLSTPLVEEWINVLNSYYRPLPLLFCCSSLKDSAHSGTENWPTTVPSSRATNSILPIRFGSWRVRCYSKDRTRRPEVWLAVFSQPRFGCLCPSSWQRM